MHSCPKNILVFQRAVKHICSSTPSGKGLPTFFQIILGLIYTVKCFIAAKNPRLCFYTLYPAAMPSNPDQQLLSVLQVQAVNANLAKSTYQI